MWVEGFISAFRPDTMLFLVIGTLYGLFIGALPGVGPVFGVASMLPLTYSMPADTAIIFLAAIHASTAYGDSIASILINTPGGAGSVASCWDGYPLARSGKAGMALGISTGGSLFGGIVGWLSLVMISPVLINVALMMGPAEYAMIALLALTLLAVSAEGQLVKGLVLCGIGLMLTFIGSDPINGFLRYTFGFHYLDDGVSSIPVLLGLFAMSQAIKMSASGDSFAAETFAATDRVSDGVRVIFQHWPTLIRSGIIGIILGVMPALGISSASIVAYMYEKRSAKGADRAAFGHGNVKGLLAPETAKAACVVGDLVPTLTLGIPGSAATALFLAALMLHGIDPGPDFFVKGGILPYTVFVGILLAQITFSVFGFFLARYFAKVIQIPNSMLVPGIVMLCFLGAYAQRNEPLDVLLMLVFGVIGYVLTRYKYPTICIVLGLVLGDMLEGNYQRALLIGNGNPLVFITEPISGLIFLLVILSVASPYLGPLWNRLRGKKVQPAEVPVAVDDDDD